MKTKTQWRTGIFALVLYVLSNTQSVAFSAHSGATALPPGDHLILVGETLSILADRYGVSVGEIAKINRIRNVDRIRAGRTLTIPSAAPPVREQRIALALTQVEALYRGALFGDARRALADPLLDGSLNPAVKAQVEFLRGQVDAAFGLRAEAREHFEAALALQPELRLRRGASPKVVALFSSIRAEPSRR